jgi:hypothetical protein
VTIYTFYRAAVWIPLVVPGLVALAVHGLGLRPGWPFDKIVQILLASLVWGGIPYAALAVWGVFWIGGRPEAEIRRGALRTPLWMIVAFVPLPALVAVRSANPGMAAAVFVLGAFTILALGYVYVMLVLGVRTVVSGLFGLSPR